MKKFSLLSVLIVFTVLSVPVSLSGQIFLDRSFFLQAGMNAVRQDAAQIGGSGAGLFAGIGYRVSRFRFIANAGGYQATDDFFTWQHQSTLQAPAIDLHAELLLFEQSRLTPMLSAGCFFSRISIQKKGIRGEIDEYDGYQTGVSAGSRLMYDL